MLHVCAIATDGVLWHTVQYDDAARSWNPWGNASQVIENSHPDSPRPVLGSEVSCVGVRGELHVAGLSKGQIWHTVRYADGNWGAWDEVISTVVALNPGSTDPGAAFNVSCASVQGELHMCIQTGTGIFHAIRNINGGWTPWGPVTPQVLSGGPPQGYQSVRLDEVAIDQVAGNLQFFTVILDNGKPTAWVGRPFGYSYRLSATGAWGQLQVGSGNLLYLDGAGTDTHLSLCGTTLDRAASTEGELLAQTIPYSEEWGAFENVRDQVLTLHPGSFDPIKFNTTKCAANGDELVILTNPNDPALNPCIVRRTAGAWSTFQDLTAEIVNWAPRTPRPALTGSFDVAFV